MKSIRFKEAATLLLIMLIILGTAVIKFGLSPQIPVLFVIALLIFWVKLRGASWDEIHKGIQEGIGTAIIPIFIFILIGALIAVWIQAGVIPTIMIVGFKLISSQFFVPSTFIVCSLVGLSIGSGFTTISTIGIALFGMGVALNANPALVAGAIISGAVFGDKMSPLSDSTNLASAIAGSDLFAHIKNMMWSTIPSFIVSLILFWFFGNSSSHMSAGKIAHTMAILNQQFTISWWALLPIALMFICAWRHIPAIPTLFINIIVTVVMIFFQKPGTSLQSLAKLISDGFVAHTSDATVNTLLTRGGISSMMGTVSLIIVTLSLGEF